MGFQVTRDGTDAFFLERGEGEAVVLDIDFGGRRRSTEGRGEIAPGVEWSWSNGQLHLFVLYGAERVQHVRVPFTTKEHPDSVIAGD